MPLVEIASVEQADRDPDARLWDSCIDAPQQGTVVDGESVDTWGWALSRTHDAVAIEFVQNDRLLRRVPLNVSRPDLLMHFPQLSYERALGFKTEIPIVGRLAEFRIEVRCVLNTGARIAIGTVVGRRAWREKAVQDRVPALVSVVVPCFNQAHYLSEAIESVRAQTYPQVELVVIDDGSHDNTVEIVGRYPGARYVPQTNQGLAAARNTGIRQSNGAYLVFLDADDRLAPGALQAGLTALQRCPEAAFASGCCRWIAADGAPLPTPEHGCPAGDHFTNLLRANYTGMPATILYRREVFEVVRGFDTTGAFRGAEDYELALRIARQFPICCHREVVADYRQRTDSMSRNAAVMLESVLSIMRSQRPYVRDHPEHRAAYKAGIRFWRHYYGRPLVKQVEGHAQQGHWRRVLAGAWALALRYPQGLAAVIWQPSVRTHQVSS